MKNAEQPFPVGVGSKKSEDCEGLKNFGTGGDLLLGGEGGEGVSTTLHVMSQMPCNVVFPTEINFPIR